MKIDPKLYDVLTEGSTSILFPKNHVFYNPVQQYNRDLSSLAIRAFTNMYQAESQSKKRSKQPLGASKIPHRDQKVQFQANTANNAASSTSPSSTSVPNSTVTSPVPDNAPFAKVLEALSASGLRAIRYSKEIPLVEKIIANDLSKSAVESIQLNVDYNEANEKVQPNESNAITHMSTHPNEYHVIDLDPYGTVAPFVDSAINSVKNGGLLLITCTDLGVLAGNGYPEKCFSLYGGTNVWGDASHESALRLVLGLVGRTAAKYGVAIEPVLSLSIDFYVRVFVRVWEKPIKVKEFMAMNEVVVKCSGCYASQGQGLGKMQDGNAKGNKFGLCKVDESMTPNCIHCGYTNHICGPIWGGQLHDKKFIDEILKLVEEEENKGEKSHYGTIKRVRGMLTMAGNELGIEGEDYEEQRASQLYFATTTISRVLKIPAPSIDEYCMALGNLGFKASLTHAASNCIKTNAPWSIIWFIGYQLALKANVDFERMSKTTAGYAILQNEKIKNAVDLRKCMPDGENKSEEELINWLFSKNEVSEKVHKLRKIKIVKFQTNPTKNWGPKARPK